MGLAQDEIDPATMPLFSLAVTVIDRVTPQRADLVAEMIAYGGNDLLCYRADDDELAGRQASQWQHGLSGRILSLGTVGGGVRDHAGDTARHLSSPV